MIQHEPAMTRKTISSPKARAAPRLRAVSRALPPTTPGLLPLLLSTYFQPPPIGEDRLGSIAVHVDDRLGEGLRRFLGQIVADAA